MRRWIGRWIAGVGVVHNLVGFFFFAEPLLGIAAAGFWNSVHMDPMRNLAFWFLFSGFLLILLGYLVDWIEARLAVLPQGLGWTLLAMLLVGVITMPVSGFWLIIPAVAGCFHARSGAPAAVVR